MCGLAPVMRTKTFHRSESFLIDYINPRLRTNAAPLPLCARSKNSFLCFWCSRCNLSKCCLTKRCCLDKRQLLLNFLLIPLLTDIVVPPLISLNRPTILALGGHPAGLKLLSPLLTMECTVPAPDILTGPFLHPCAAARPAHT